MFFPPNSHEAPRPEVVAADQQHKWEGQRRTWRQWVITALIVAIFLAIIIVGFVLIPQ